VHTGFWWKNPREGDHSYDQDVDGKITLKLVFEKWDREAWSESLWFRIGTGDELLSMRR
jgi:hypothetical protein